MPKRRRSRRMATGSRGLAVGVIRCGLPFRQRLCSYVAQADYSSRVIRIALPSFGMGLVGYFRSEWTPPDFHDLVRGFFPIRAPSAFAEARGAFLLFRGLMISSSSGSALRLFAAYRLNGDPGDRLRRRCHYAARRTTASVKIAAIASSSASRISPARYFSSSSPCKRTSMPIDGTGE